MPIRRPQISFRGPWVRDRGTSIAGESTDHSPLASVEPAAGAPELADDAASDPDVAPAIEKRGRARPAAAKPRRVVKSRLHVDPDEDNDEPALRSASIRVVLVEDVTEVAAHIRELFRLRPQIKLLDVLADSSKAIERIRELEVDVVIVDTLLQGRVKGPNLIDRIRKADLPVGIVAITVPDRPLNDRRAAAVDAVLTMPFGAFDLARGVADARGAASVRNPTAGSRTVAVFASKGGVGTTTIAYNLAASLQSSGLKTILVDGSLQFGDLRRLLRIPPDASSILDLPTDAVRQSDIDGVVFRDTSGIDVLAAPARPEMAELMTDRDLAAVFDLLRRTYQAIVIDTPSNLGGATLAMLDAADVVLQVVTPDPATIESARVAYQTFSEIGYPPSKLRFLVNRLGSIGGFGPDRLARALGCDPDFTIRNDWQLVSGSNAEGIPFVLARPEAPVSIDVRTLAGRMTAIGSLPPLIVPGRTQVRGASLVEARRR
ncbi:MAG TPA: AAA family ATPase [Candidatus Limnocylindrales bacterium]|nr:AAA family ATPase [Candidatus Limnocylindrales bacterium]